MSASSKRLGSSYGSGGRVSSAISAPELHERTRWVFEPIPEGVARLLDAGCHDRATAAAFRPRAASAFGIDLDANAIRSGQSRFPEIHILQASGAAIPFND